MNKIQNNNYNFLIKDIGKLLERGRKEAFRKVIIFLLKLIGILADV